MSQTISTHLEMIKEAVHQSDIVSEEEKHTSVKIIEGWPFEDKTWADLVGSDNTRSKENIS